MELLHIILQLTDPWLKNLCVPIKQNINTSCVLHSIVNLPFKLFFPLANLDPQPAHNCFGNPAVEADNIRIKQSKLERDADVDLTINNSSPQVVVHVRTQPATLYDISSIVMFYTIFSRHS